MYVLSSNFRSFSFSWPSAEIQSPHSRSCTFRVGPDVIGTSYWQALKVRAQRQIATPTPRNQAKLGFTEFCLPLRTGLRRNRQGQECIEYRSDRRFPSPSFVVRAAA